MTASQSALRPFLRAPAFWAMAVRAYAYPASIVPVALGAAYSAYAHRADAAFRFSWGAFIVALIAGMLYHTACNLLNDYYDTKHGVDRPGTYGGSGVMLRGELSGREVLGVAYACLALGVLLGICLLLYMYTAYDLQAALTLLIIGVAGALGAVFYTTTPGSAKYSALGEPLVFLMMGPGMVLGSYIVLTGTVTWNAVWVSLPVACIVTAILHANDTRDIADDRASGIRTAAILLGPTRARVLLSALYFAPYVILLILAATRIAPWMTLLALTSFPLMWPLHRLFWTVREEKSEKLKGSVENTAKLHLAFGLLMSLGVLLGIWLM
jgi:1,4-dihydroxy-2-naphthoate octaprenyltransferase